MPVTTKATTLYSLATFAAWVKATAGGSEDSRLKLCADGASEEIERQTGRIFTTRAVTETRSGDGKTIWFTRYRPVASLTVTIDGVAVPSSGCVVNAVTGKIELNGYRFTAGVGNVALAYTGGFDAQDGANLPSDIVRAALDLGKAMWDELVSNAIAATSVNLGPASMVIKAAKIPPSVQRVIDTWKDVRG